MSRAKDFLLWLYWKPFKRFVQATGAPGIYTLAGVLGNIMYAAARSRRRKFLGEMERLRESTGLGVDAGLVARQAFISGMCNEMEMLCFPALNASNIQACVRCEGLGHLDEALGQGRGVLLLFGHFGANQMIMPAMGYNGYRMSQLSAPATVWKEKMPNRSFSRMELKSLEMRWEHEKSLPVRHINIFGSLKDAFVCLRGNGILGVAIDGGGGASRHVFDFLGRKALVSTGPLDIAARTGSVVLPVFMTRPGLRGNVLVIEPPIPQSGDIRDAAWIMSATKHFLACMEKYVLEWPHLYLSFLVLRRMMIAQGDTPLFPEDA